MITLYEEGQSTSRKSRWRVNCHGCDPTVTVSVTMPLGYTISPLKLTRGDSKGRNLPGSNFSYWKAER